MSDYRKGLEEAVLEALKNHKDKWFYASDLVGEVAERFPPLRPLSQIGSTVAVGRTLAQLSFLVKKHSPRGTQWFILIPQVS